MKIETANKNYEIQEFSRIFERTYFLGSIRTINLLFIGKDVEFSYTLPKYIFSDFKYKFSENKLNNCFLIQFLNNVLKTRKSDFWSEYFYKIGNRIYVPLVRIIFYTDISETLFEFKKPLKLIKYEKPKRQHS